MKRGEALYGMGRFNSFVAILEAWLSCVAVYYVYQVVLRWVKVIE